MVQGSRPNTHSHSILDHRTGTQHTTELCVKWNLVQNIKRPDSQRMVNYIDLLYRSQWTSRNNHQKHANITLSICTLSRRPESSTDAMKPTSDSESRCKCLSICEKAESNANLWACSDRERRVLRDSGRTLCLSDTVSLSCSSWATCSGSRR